MEIFSVAVLLKAFTLLTS